MAGMEDFEVFQNPIAARPSPEAEELARLYIDLAQPRLGTEVVFASDDFFAPKERMIDPKPPVFVPGRYDENGKWMDGWESRRKREAGHDFAILRLGRPGRIRALDIDTSHFTGNFPPAASVETTYSEDRIPGTNADWREIVPATTLSGDSHHVIGVTGESIASHIRLNIFPDGGIARLRVFGEVAMDWSAHDSSQDVDLASMLVGGRAVAWSDAHYGAPNNILAPGRGVDMGDGWETRRRREPGNDWIIVALAHPGDVTRVTIDTAHFKGNFPAAASLQGAMAAGGTAEALVPESMFWPVLLPEKKLEADKELIFDIPESDLGPVSHVRLNIVPDGGISRLRLFGRIRH